MILRMKYALPLALALAAGVANAGTMASAAELPYLPVEVQIHDYKVVPYMEHNLVQIEVTIVNHNPLIGYLFDDECWNGCLLLHGEESHYDEQGYGTLRSQGIDITAEDCHLDHRDWVFVDGSIRTKACYLTPKHFEPDAFSLLDDQDETGWQIIPLATHSHVCNLNYDNCNKEYSYIVGSPRPEPPAPEPVDPPAGATLLHTIYNNHTGILTMVFDDLVVAHNPDRISLIHDIDAYIDDGASPDLGDSELYTVDGKRQSAVLSFALDGALRLAVTESLRTHGDLVLYIETRAVYAADGFVDITDGEPVLVPDIMVVR